MDIQCSAEKLYPSIEKLMRKLSDGILLNKNEDKKLRDLLDQYWDIECPFDGQNCVANKCSFAAPCNWIEYHGYISMADLLEYFEYDEMKVLKLSNKVSTDTMNVHWARRPGHFNP